MRKAGKTVGVVAVDPSSPFAGGALLGDRIRMTQHYLDKGVFIRSWRLAEVMGAFPARPDVAKLLDAQSRFLMIETVGVGQTELDVMGATDTVLVTVVPEAGDGASDESWSGRLLTSS
jgi:LAO/AO transport system kinase